MPELPEVETVRLGLQRTIVNQTIKSISILLPKMFIGDPIFLVDATISAVNRRGKLLIISVEKVDTQYSLLIHLKMTGQLIFKNHATPSRDASLPNKNTKVIVHFHSNDTLYFNDQRTFGYMKLIPTDQLHENQFLQKVGIEPLTPEFTFEKLTQLLKKRSKSNIKAFLLDQTQIAGLGNIYTDEALFRAGVLPWRIVSSLTEPEMHLLHKSIVTVLQAGIELQGASHTSYIMVDGTKGTFLTQAAVYDRKGLSCPQCRQPIQKTKWAGRGTHYCPHCQT